MEVFEEFYASQYRGRRVQWLVRTGEGPSAHELVIGLTITRVQHNLGKAEVRALCMQRRYEFTVTTHQLCILLQFNEHEDAITHATLSTATNMPENYLVRALKVRTRTLSLSLSRSRTPCLFTWHTTHTTPSVAATVSRTLPCAVVDARCHEQPGLVLRQHAIPIRQTQSQDLLGWRRADQHLDHGGPRCGRERPKAVPQRTERALGDSVRVRASY